MRVSVCVCECGREEGGSGRGTGGVGGLEECGSGRGSGMGEGKVGWGKRTKDGVVCGDVRGGWGIGKKGRRRRW